MACSISFIDGDEVSEENMNPNTIYIDGAVRGPVINAEEQSYSFDHHGDAAPRLSLKATCIQVAEALELGLEAQIETDNFTVVLNDIDADSVLSAWLCQNPGAWRSEKVQDLVEQVGFVDSHGPTRSPHDLHNALGCHPASDKDLEMVQERLEILDEWYENGTVPDSFTPPGGTAIGLNAKGERLEIETDSGFDAFYEAGGVVGLVHTESDFVPGELPVVLDALNEIEPNDDGEWGGSSTVGGSPRPNGSQLKPEQVFELIELEFRPKLDTRHVSEEELEKARNEEPDGSLQQQ